MADDEHVWLSAVEQQREMEAGRLTSRGLALDYINRIKQLDWGGPRLKSVLEVNPEALEIASALDNERQKIGARSPLHGVCVLLKDNIDMRLWINELMRNQIDESLREIDIHAS